MVRRLSKDFSGAGKHETGETDFLPYGCLFITVIFHHLSGVY